MTIYEISTQLDNISEQLASAVSEYDSERLAQVLEAQKEFVTDHLELLDDGSKRRIQSDVEWSLLHVKAARAHCLDAILVNQRKLGVLTAYQAG
jgi:hypothetical protein